MAACAWQARQSGRGLPRAAVGETGSGRAGPGLGQANRVGQAVGRAGHHSTAGRFGNGAKSPYFVGGYNMALELGFLCFMAFRSKELPTLPQKTPCFRDGLHFSKFT